MNGNYEWQKHQTNERIDARMKEANAHRLAKTDAAPRRPWHWLRTLLRRALLRTPSPRGPEPSMRKRPSG